MNPKISKILLPVEFSERCHGAARYAEALTSHFQAELVLLHAVPPPYSVYVGAGEVAAYSSVADLGAERLAQGKTELDAFMSDAPPNLRICRMVLEGDPAHSIVEYAHAGKVDLIVMPTHGYGPFRRFLLGSVTAKVLHDVDCPVWTGPHLEKAPSWTSIAPHRVACAVDLGIQSLPVLRWGAAMAQEFGAHLLILHAIPAATANVGGFYFDPEWRLQWEKDVRERISQLQDELKVQGELHIETGDVPAAVSDAARHLRADLLVIGRSHGSGPLGRLRANAYAILRDSPCPVVSI
jgi:nucleotide-binding universal stress UspA family protein